MPSYDAFGLMNFDGKSLVDRIMTNLKAIIYFLKFYYDSLSAAESCISCKEDGCRCDNTNTQIIIDEKIK